MLATAYMYVLQKNEIIDSLVLRPVPLCFMDTYFWDSVYWGKKDSHMQGAGSSGNRSNQPRQMQWYMSFHFEGVMYRISKGIA